MIKRIIGWGCIGAFLLSTASLWAGDESTQTITILHTNDLHSHYQPDQGPISLGGVARLKTKVNQLRKELPHSILVDGGDFSEGNVYYTIGTGKAAFQMMDSIGYDVAVIGNHDWLNGPDHLLQAMSAARAHTKYVSANLSVNSYERSSDFQRWIPPYAVKQFKLSPDLSVKVAFYRNFYL